jgi:transposase
MKNFIVRLTTEERQQLEALVKKGRTQAYRIKHANILLAVDANGANLCDTAVAKAFSCHINTVGNVRQRFVEQGLDAALERKKREYPARWPILDGEKEAKLIALACSEPPAGHSRWTLNLLAEKLVELQIVESICGQTVRRALKKTSFVPIARNVG